MKKILLQLFSWFFPNEKDLVKNKYEILTLLFTSDHQNISSKDSILLMDSVKKEFDSELKKRYLEAQIEIEDIDTYFRELNK